MRTLGKSWFCLFLAFLATLNDAFAHQTSDSYLALSVTNNRIEGRWAIAIRDLNHVLMLDNDTDGEISDSELEEAKPGIQSFSYDRLKLTSDGQTLDLKHKSFELQELDSAFYIVLLFDAVPGIQPIPDLGVEYSLFFDTDPAHRGLVRIDFPKTTETTILGPSHPSQRFFLDEPQTGASFGRFVKEGIWHIWIGFDHILFLIALLLPSVLERTSGGGWGVTADLRVALLNIFKIVTAFTIAHSVTLTLATLGWVRLPGRLIESVIAASVLLAAVNNLKPIFPERTWIIAFTFGLIHGFGFATVLAELNLPAGSLGWALFGFNLGVELGQLAIVLAFVPIAFSCRRSMFYQQGALRFGSLLIAAISAVWFAQRAFNL